MKKILLVFILCLGSTLSVLAEGGRGSSVTVLPAPSAHKLEVERIHYFPQTWNNCGGATISMGLTYFGFVAEQNSDQELARQYLKPNWEDQNVSPWQILDYVNTEVGDLYNVRALSRAGGDFEILKQLLANDFPVILEKGYEEQDLDWMGHYVLLVGYDDAEQVFYSYDSFLGSNRGNGRAEPYDKTAKYWRHFNNLFIVLYEPQREAEVQAILGELWTEPVGWQRAKASAQREAAANQYDYVAWFNLGEAASHLGEYEVAVVAYEYALNTGSVPWRTMWYLHGAFEAYYQTGRFKSLLTMAIRLQEVTPYIEEANYYRGLVYAAQGNTDQAIFRFDRVLEFNPNFYPAAEAKQAVLDGTFVGPVQTDS